jgi:flavodoxin
MVDQFPGRTLLVLSSYHHRNTEKIAKVIADILDAKIVAPEDAHPNDLQEADLIGFGSGIYGAKHHEAVLDLAERLPLATGKRAFIFSTSAIITQSKVASDHATLRDILTSKGYVIADEFSCKGFNTNSFLKFLGGMNKGRPNEEDLANARSFALGLK